MPRPAPTVLLVAALMSGAGPTLAQTQTETLAQTQTPPQSRSQAAGAAATLPNTFDPPARRTAPTAVTTARASPPAAGPTAGQVTEADMAEGALRAVIADLKADQIDADLFTPDMAGRLRPQLAALGPLVRGYGALGPIEAQGVSNGANQFQVTFENAVTQWLVGLDEDGRIAALLFRPAPPVSSEPEVTGDAER